MPPQNNKVVESTVASAAAPEQLVAVPTATVAPVGTLVKPVPEHRQAPQEYRDMEQKWRSLSTMLQTVYVGLGLIATASSLVLATFTTELGTAWVKGVSFALSLSLGVITAFNVGAEANGVRSAWRVLKAAILAYENDQNFTIQDLYKQYVAGEALIGDIKYNAPERPKLP